MDNGVGLGTTTIITACYLQISLNQPMQAIERFRDGELSAEQNALMVKKYVFGAHGDK